MAITRRSFLSVSAAGVLLPAVQVSTASAAEPEVDVLVVGGGFSGLAAAVTAARNGAKTVLMEKRPQTGGDGAISSGVFQTYKTHYHDEQGITEKVGPEDYWARFTDGLDDEPLAKIRDNTPVSPIYYGLNKHNPEVIKKAALYAPKVIEFVDGYGIKFMPLNKAMPYRMAMAPGNPAKFAAGMLQELKDKNVPVMRNTRATELLMDNGKVVGVKYLKKNGQEGELRAKNVILATGGFINNEYLMGRYKGFWTQLPSVVKGIGETLPKDRTGDGIVMGKKIGAALEDMESMPKLGSRLPYDKPFISWLLVDVEPAFVVAPDGKRVGNEYISRYSGICLDLLQHKHKKGALVIGTDTFEGKNTKRFNLQNAYEKGVLHKADTPEELAKAVGVDPEALKATLETWNRDAAAGKDTQFGRTDPFFKPLRPPYYISDLASVAIYKTEGGLEVNPNFQVIRADNDQPIPGLYAAGAGCGSITSRHSEVVASGMIAGEHAAKNAK